MMDEVQKSSDFEYYTPSSELFRIFLIVYLKIKLMAQTLHREMILRLVDDELEGIWKEAIRA
jgi:hypothetical protein